MKQQALEELRARLHAKLETLRRAVAETHDNATSAETKSEGKYDTRGLEASYLAGAQAEQIEFLERALLRLEHLDVEETSDTAALGSIVVLATEDAEKAFFLLPAGAGEEVEVGGMIATVVTPESRAGQDLLGSSVGDTIPLPDDPHAFVSELW